MKSKLKTFSATLVKYHFLTIVLLKVFNRCFLKFSNLNIRTENHQSMICNKIYLFYPSLSPNIENQIGFKS
jgi:hypothetical protein